MKKNIFYYHLEANVGYSDYEYEFDIDKIKEEFNPNTNSLSDFLIEYLLDNGKEISDISSHCGDFDPYLTEVHVTQDQYNQLKELFPDQFPDSTIVID